MTGKLFSTNYLTAVNWLRGDLILCNNICEVDNDFYISYYDTISCECEEDEDTDCLLDVYQWFLTSYSDSDVEYLREHFGLLFVYSNALELWVLAVTHYGTAWDYVPCDTDLECAARRLGER